MADVSGKEMFNVDYNIQDGEIVVRMRYDEEGRASSKDGSTTIVLASLNEMFRNLGDLRGSGREVKLAVSLIESDKREGKSRGGSNAAIQKQLAATNDKVDKLTSAVFTLVKAQTANAGKPANGSAHS